MPWLSEHSVRICQFLHGRMAQDGLSNSPHGQTNLMVARSCVRDMGSHLVYIQGKLPGILFLLAKEPCLLSFSIHCGTALPLRQGCALQHIVNH